jgi:hypothetical protein
MPRKTTTSAMRILPVWLLMTLASSLAGMAAPLRAQQEPAAPQQEVSQAPKKQPGIARQLAHETREAAGEEADETAEFKQSASVRLIAKWTGMSLLHAYWLSVLSNFVVIAVVIFWASRKYLPGMFSARTAAIQKAMQEAQKASDEARRKLAEIESRLMKARTDGVRGRFSRRTGAEADSRGCCH